MTTKSLTMVLAAAALVACTTAQPKNEGAPTTITQADTRACPLGVPGSSVRVEDTADGVVLSFTTEGDPTELRQRVFDASAMYGPGARMGKGHDGQHGEGGKHGLQTAQLPPVSAGSAEIPGGARIRFTPSDPSDLDVLRAKLHARAAQLNATPCKSR